MKIFLHNIIAEFNNIHSFCFLSLFVLSVFVSFCLFDRIIKSNNKILLSFLFMIALSISLSSFGMIIFGNMQKDYCSQTKICFTKID